jgi:DNA-binding MarR family transcriptional regulator
MKQLRTGDLVIVALFDAGSPIKVKQICKEIVKSPAAVSSALHNLKARKLVYRILGHKWELTEEGRTEMRRIMPKLGRELPDNGWHLPPSEKRIQEREPIPSLMPEPATKVSEETINWQREYIQLANKLVDAIGRAQ